MKQMIRTARTRVPMVLVLVLTMIATVSIASAPSASAALYPSGCSSRAIGGSVYAHRQWCWVGANGSLYDNKSNMAVMIQRILKGDGYYAGTIDGQFGSVSATATDNYQQAKGLVDDGVVGSDTWVSLMYNSIADCGILTHSGYSTFAYKIASEGCGRYIQQYGDYEYIVRRYNNNGTSAANPNGSNAWIVVSTNGPTAYSSAAASTEQASSIVDTSEAADVAAIADQFELDVVQAQAEVPQATSEPLVETSDFATEDGTTFSRTSTWADQAAVDDYFSHLQSYPDELAYLPATFEGLPGVERQLSDGTWQAFAYDASSGELVNVQLEVEDPDVGLDPETVSVGEAMLTTSSN